MACDTVTFDSGTSVQAFKRMPIGPTRVVERFIKYHCPRLGPEGVDLAADEDADCGG
jgi:hypothetical protein